MPLRVCAENPRYFADERGDAVYLTGSHTWNNLQDLGPRLDFTDYLDRLVAYGHNFTRLWVFEQAWGMQWARERDFAVSPTLFRRTGPELAHDGQSRFDLTQLNEAFFLRQRERVGAAARRDVYVSVMLFMGFSVHHVDDDGVPWSHHPFHRQNNVNGIDGDPGDTGTGVDTHTLANSAITRLQEAYVQKVVRNLNEFDNVLFEISNESPKQSTHWQHHMLRFVRQVEAGLPKRHPVGMTFQYGGGANATLWESPADWVSPNAEGGWSEDPPGCCPDKVVLSDTDHLWGIGGTPTWVWKTFTRGHNPIFMDPWDDQLITAGDNPWNCMDPEPMRRAMGVTRRVAAELALTRCRPRSELSSTRYCLAEPDVDYVAFQPEDGPFDLEVVPASYRLRWIDPIQGTVLLEKPNESLPSRSRMHPPKSGPVVLRLSRSGHG